MAMHVLSVFQRCLSERSEISGIDVRVCAVFYESGATKILSYGNHFCRTLSNIVS